ncbi:Deformed epidermal autoregulatory factor 1 [Labeo rohita]|uniref:Deformed epidermal autoregulatory factor 1 n=1 Tax=Labeo rohita TaxID=84645 RepID=A0ABQ8MUJ0_LABRO|nr:Deformed epidermal autoregulatory factor 1 [Labeo rohita]
MNKGLLCLEQHEGERDCVKYGSDMISPYLFEKKGGKGSSKSWKTSILCQGTPLKSVMDLPENFHREEEEEEEAGPLFPIIPGVSYFLVSISVCKQPSV